MNDWKKEHPNADGRRWEGMVDALKVLYNTYHKAEVDHTERFTVEILMKNGDWAVKYFDSTDAVLQEVQDKFDEVEEYQAYDNVTGEIVLPKVTKKG